jgi:DNA replication ATP-dependent helicase Dna2
MVAQDSEQQDEAKHECFLCVLDSQAPCALHKLEGRIVAAVERLLNGEKVPIIIIDTGTTRAELHLTHYYSTFVRELRERGMAIRQLVLRLYHLPTPPTIVESKGQPRHIYVANSYTLAVLEPDVLLNITDLNQAEYCSRQYLLNSLVPSTTTAATIRGNLVHHCFKELLKEHDRGELMRDHDREGQETPLAILQRHFEQALAHSSIDLALANVTSEQMREEAAPHLASLATWYQNESATLWDMPNNGSTGSADSEPGNAQRDMNVVRAETFLLAPEIGLRGRLDLLWQQSNRHRLLELKTGGSAGDLPKANHRWQVYGYHALLTVRRNPRMEKALATLLYSGTPGEAQAFGLKSTVRELQRVNTTRNMLVLSHVLGTPSAPPGPSRCTKCSMLDQCMQVSALLGWLPPEPDRGNDEQGNGHKAERVGASLVEASPTPTANGGRAGVGLQHVYSEEDRAFFARYYRLLHMEGREGEQQLALLWQTPVAERIERGAAISELRPLGPAEPSGQGEWEQEFACMNTSELRESDEILLSDGDPVRGEVVTGMIKHISAERVRVWSPELIAHPKLIDRYENNLVHARTVQNLLRWLQADAHLRDLVSGKVRPRFTQQTIFARPDFNAEQNLAVERALQMQDYLLVQGPPGTGKTSVIAEIVKRLCQQGQRVMLAAFTNQAVDNMLKRLDAEGFHDYVRLGHERGVDMHVQERLLQKLVETQEPSVRKVLRATPVVASTAATWSAEKYSAQVGGTIGALAQRENALLQFDVAIVDEASQLTIPAILGPLRLARRFILVGDEKQLPPLVLSKEAAEQGLSDSLFSYLKQLDDDYTKEQSAGESACVSLRTQYRMNRWISNFSSRVFYEGALVAAPTVAMRVLELAATSMQAVQETSTVQQALQPAYPLVFLDVRGDEGIKAGSKSSNAEARAVRAVVQGLLARGIGQQDIGIIAPFRAQVANIRRHLFSDDSASGWQGLAPATPLSVDTVDRFQGGERMVIIMSFATAQAPESSSPLREFLTNPHRLNVALTRAQRKLIVVGCASALEGLPYFERLLKYCRSMQTVITYDEG